MENFLRDVSEDAHLGVPAARSRFRLLGTSRKRMSGKKVLPERSGRAGR
jgi:hypothetical protein